MTLTRQVDIFIKQVHLPLLGDSENLPSAEGSESLPSVAASENLPSVEDRDNPNTASRPTLNSILKAVLQQMSSCNKFMLVRFLSDIFRYNACTFIA